MNDDLANSYVDRSDEELYDILGANLLGGGPEVPPVVRDHVRRVARNWFDDELQRLRQRVRASATYRAWLESEPGDRTAGVDLIARILRDEGDSDERAAALAVLLDRTNRRDALAGSEECYDFAVSFAGGQHAYVEATVTAAGSMGLRGFYDRDMVHEWWGRNYITVRRKVYARGALFFVPFISEEYLAKQIPRDEFAHAMLKAVEQGDHYILPILVGSVVVPPELLHPHLGHLRTEGHTPEALAARLRARTDEARSPTHPSDPAVHTAAAARLLTLLVRP